MTIQEAQRIADSARDLAEFRTEWRGVRQQGEAFGDRRFKVYFDGDAMPTPKELAQMWAPFNIITGRIMP